MKIDVTVKSNHQEFLNQVVRDYSLGGSDQAIQSLIQYSLSQNGHDQIFGEIRCVGQCRSPDQSILNHWKDEYNNVRPHSSLADQVPAHFGGSGPFIPGPIRLGFSP